jgi:hypothetical protein
MNVDLELEGEMILGSPRSAVLTPRQYIKLSADERANIARVQIVPPRLGGDFGRIRVIYKPGIGTHLPRR